jgi:hypothetical protein
MTYGPGIPQVVELEESKYTARIVYPFDVDIWRKRNKRTGSVFPFYSKYQRRKDCISYWQGITLIVLEKQTSL